MSEREYVVSDYERVEYGVICDRTEVGLGKALLLTVSDLDRALEDARRYDEQCRFTHPHSHDVMQRVVRMTAWTGPVSSGEHVGGCNERCTPVSHYLIGDRR